jgi:5'-methylthioadenosine phosphorylase
MLAIIGGTLLGKVDGLTIIRREVMRTPYGEPSCALIFGEFCEQEIVFIARHGYGYTIAPQDINYRANMWALAEQGVTEVVAVLSVGGIRTDMKSGSLVVPDQIIDYTHGRENTYFQSWKKPVEYIDFTEPYCQQMRQRILQAAAAANEKVIDNGVYAATTGRRLETSAEIRRIERDGGDMVGMTGMPEAVLARELNLSYAAIAVITNAAAGKGSSRHHVDFRAASLALNGELAALHRILGRLVCAYK